MQSSTEKKSQELWKHTVAFPESGLLPDSKHYVSCSRVSVTMNTEAEFGYARGEAFVVHYKVVGFAPHGGFKELPKNYEGYPVIYLREYKR